MTLTTTSEAVDSEGQPPLFDGLQRTFGKHGTFSPNYKESIHRWYPYLEGFSSTFVETLVAEFGHERCRVHDPFAGTGTTLTTTARHNLFGSYTEINPFMRLVTECKTNVLRTVSTRKPELIKYFDEITTYAFANLPSLDEALIEQTSAFGSRPYFSDKRLQEILSVKKAILSVPCPVSAFKNLALLSLGAIAVNCSELVRKGDVRYRKGAEKLPEGFSVYTAFGEKLAQIIADVDESYATLTPVRCLGVSALEDYGYSDYVDLVITSPPYLNGTNYFRNTKVELWLAGFLSSESELGAFRDRALAAGINDISKRGRKPLVFDEVEAVASKLDKVAYDSRIPEMVRRYCSDSYLWLGNVYKLLKPNGTAIIDIGDSRFSGVHIPTDELLEVLAQKSGFDFIESRPVRRRKSNDGSPLKQVLLIFNKPTGRSNARIKAGAVDNDYKNAALDFQNFLPHTETPYSSRNWGHNLHSLCSYQGKLKPAIAHFLVRRFTSPGDKVLDPMSGSGSIPLEAFLHGRIPIGNDLQDLGFILTRAKVEWGDARDVRDKLAELLSYVERTKDSVDISQYSDFGFNGSINQYFHEDTLREILSARTFIKTHPCESWASAVVYSCLLHVLHGNRPYALSRRSHPVTPFAPTGEFEYKSVASRLTDKINRTLALELGENRINGTATRLPFSELSYENEIDAVITSPPFAASTRFFVANWMRLWMAGWEKNDFTTRRDEFLEHRQKKSMDAYYAFFSSCHRWLKPRGRLILHVGRTATVNMAKELIRRCGARFELVHWFDEDVAGREKFGIRDQGATTSHQYLFFTKK